MINLDMLYGTVVIENEDAYQVVRDDVMLTTRKLVINYKDKKQFENMVEKFSNHRYKASITISNFTTPEQRKKFLFGRGKIFSFDKYKDYKSYLNEHGVEVK